MSQNSELDVLKSVEESLDSVDADARSRILTWINSKYGTAAPSPAQPVKRRQPTKNVKTGDGKPSKTRKPVVLKILKELNLKPQGKKSFSDFVGEKSPVNLLEKCTISVYYFSEIQGIKEVTVSHVYTAFKTMQWRLPSDLANTLQQAGTKGWLDTGVATAITVTHMGENLVEQDLPRPSTK